MNNDLISRKALIEKATGNDMYGMVDIDDILSQPSAEENPLPKVKTMSENLFEILARLRRNRDTCDGCPMCLTDNGREIADCADWALHHPKEAEEILLKWAAENPLPKPKTMADRFYEIFPEAPKRENGTPYLCVVYLGWKGKKCYLDRDCSECWNKPYK